MDASTSTHRIQAGRHDRVAGKTILTHCFEQLVDPGAEKLVVIVGYNEQNIISHYSDEFEGVPITYPTNLSRRDWHTLCLSRRSTSAAT